MQNSTRTKAEPKISETKEAATSMPALKLGSAKLRALISRHLETANDLLDEWDRDCRTETH
jgi:hypothetical protein